MASSLHEIERHSWRSLLYYLAPSMGQDIYVYQALKRGLLTGLNSESLMCDLIKVISSTLKRLLTLLTPLSLNLYHLA